MPKKLSVEGTNGASHQRHFSTSAKWRQRAGEIVKRLYQNSLGLPDANGNIVDMSATQIQSGMIVLRKIIPDLAVQTLLIERQPAIDVDQARARIQMLLAERPELLALLSPDQANSLPPLQNIPKHQPVTIDQETDNTTSPRRGAIAKTNQTLNTD